MKTLAEAYAAVRARIPEDPDIVHDLAILDGFVAMSNVPLSVQMIDDELEAGDYSAAMERLSAFDSARTMVMGTEAGNGRDPKTKHDTMTLSLVLNSHIKEMVRIEHLDPARLKLIRDVSRDTIERYRRTHMQVGSAGVCFARQVKCNDKQNCKYKFTDETTWVCPECGHPRRPCFGKLNDGSRRCKWHGGKTEINTPATEWNSRAHVYRMATAHLPEMGAVVEANYRDPNYLSLRSEIGVSVGLLSQVLSSMEPDKIPPSQFHSRAEQLVRQVARSMRNDNLAKAEADIKEWLEDMDRPVDHGKSIKAAQDALATIERLTASQRKYMVEQQQVITMEQMQRNMQLTRELIFRSIEASAKRVLEIPPDLDELSRVAQISSVIKSEMRKALRDGR